MFAQGRDAKRRVKRIKTVPWARRVRLTPAAADWDVGRMDSVVKASSVTSRMMNVWLPRTVMMGPIAPMGRAAESLWDSASMARRVRTMVIVERVVSVHLTPACVKSRVSVVRTSTATAVASVTMVTA